MNNNYKTYEEYEKESNDDEILDESLYNDGEDNKPKMIIIIVGIVLLIIIILLLFFACSKVNKKSDNNYLNSIRITNGQLSPEYNRETLNYSVSATEDIVTVSCSSESSKATTSGCNKRIYLTDNCIEHVIKVTSESKSERQYVLNICKVNQNAPIIKSVDINPTTYTKDSVTVTIVAESETPLHTEAYSIDDGITWQESNKFIIKENKTLYIKVRNKDNIETSTIVKTINNIDNSKMSVKIKGSIDSGVSTTSNVELTAIVTPSSSVSGYKYRWYKGNTKISGATKPVYTATSSGQYKVVVTTGSGNSATSDVYNVNKKSSSGGSTSHTLSISSVSGNPVSWTNKDVTLTINAKASNGLHNTPYSFDGGKTFQKSSSKVFDKNQTVNIVVRDSKNKKTTYNVYITKIDKTNPTVVIIGNYYIGERLTAKTTPTSTVSGYKYQWYKDNKVISGATDSSYVPTSIGNYQVKVTTGAGNIKASSGVVVSNRVTPTVTLTSSVSSGVWTKNNVTLTATVRNGTATKYEWYKNNIKYTSCTTSKCVISTEGEATYKVIALTSNGTTGPSQSITVKIDKTAPSLKIDAYLGGYGEVGYAANSWTSQTVYILARATDSGSEISEMYFQYLESDVSQNRWYYGATNAWDSKIIIGPTGEAKVDFNATGYYPFKVKVKDKVGNETIKEYPIKIDKTAPSKPTINLSSSSETSSNVTFTITNGTDSHSGIAKSQYSYDNKTWTNYSSAVTLLSNTGVKTVYARTIDKLNNVSASASAVGKCDKDQVSISTDALNSSNFVLGFSLKNTGITGITSGKYEYIYYNVTQTSDTSNKQSADVTRYCGTKPPVTEAKNNSKFYTTTNSKTKNLYLKYQYQYFCLAVRPYRASEISKINRWTIQRKHVGGTVANGSFNGLNTGNEYVYK